MAHNEQGRGWRETKKVHSEHPHPKPQREHHPTPVDPEFYSELRSLLRKGRPDSEHRHHPHSGR